MKYLLTLVCAVFGLAVLAASADAQCRTVRPSYYTYSNTYQYPVREVVVQEVSVITPVAVPVLVPAFQYQYVAPCSAAPVAAAPVITPQLASPGVPMQPMAYGPGVGAAPANDQERIRQLAKALLAEMSKQSDGGQDNGPPMAVESFMPQQSGVPQGMNALTVMSNRCASCHTGPSAKGGIQIFTAPGQFNQLVDRQRLMRAVEDGRMPPQAVNDPSFRLSPQEVELMRSGLR